MNTSVHIWALLLLNVFIKINFKTLNQVIITQKSQRLTARPVDVGLILVH